MGIVSCGTYFRSYFVSKNDAEDSLPRRVIDKSTEKIFRTASFHRLLALAVVIFAASLPAFFAEAGAENFKGNAGHSATSIKPDFAFFRGKTITYINDTAPGTAAALQIVGMQSALEQILGATINIENVSGAVTIGQDMVGEAAPNGLTIGDASAPADLNGFYTDTNEVNFSLLKASWVGSTYSSAGIVVACEGSPFTSFVQVIKGDTPASWLVVAGGSFAEFDHLVMSAWPIPHKYITGYVAATQPAGCQRGDGNLSSNILSFYLNAAGTSVLPNTVPLLLTGTITSGSPVAYLNQQVPTLAAFAKRHPPKTARARIAAEIAVSSFESSTPLYATFGPAGIPRSRILALTDAMKMAMKQSAVKQALLQDNLPLGFVTPAGIVSYLKLQLKHQSLVEGYLNS